MRTLRDVAVIMALAFGVAFMPAGGNVAEAVLTALTMGFLAAIAWMLYLLSRQNELTLATLSDGRRAILYGALGMIALLIAGTDEALLQWRRHRPLDPPSGRLGGGDMAGLGGGEYLLSEAWRGTRSRRCRERRRGACSSASSRIGMVRLRR